MAIIEWIFFDTKGSIWNDKKEHEYCRELIAELLTESGVNCTAELYEQALEQSIRAWAPDSFEAILWSFLKPDLDRWSKINQEFRKKIERLQWDTYRSFFSLNQGALRVVHTLSRSYRLGLIDQDQTRARQLLDNAGLLPLFAIQSISEKNRFSKPDPRFFDQILTQSGASPDKSVFVSNRLHLDLVPGLLFNAKTVRMMKGPMAKQEPRTPGEIPHIELDSITKLPDAIKTLEFMVV